MTFNTTDLSQTRVFSKIMCLEEVFPLHIMFAYLVVFSGIGAFFTRIRWQFLHKWFGMAFIIFMLWCTGTSLLIFNTGLPRFVIVSFLILGISMTIGLIAILIHQHIYDKLPENPTWKERFFSWKSLHGFCMTLAWYQMFGRFATTDPTADWHGCFTWPAYKELDENGHLIPLPPEDPDYAIADEALFLSLIVIPAAVCFILVGLGWSIVSSRKQDI